MTEDKQHITLQLDAHAVSLTIPRPLEPAYRRATALLNERYRFYQRKMKKASVEQLWMYVALEMGVNLHNDMRKKNIEPVEQKLNQINQQITNHLYKSNPLS